MKGGLRRSRHAFGHAAAGGMQSYDDGRPPEAQCRPSGPAAQFGVIAQALRGAARAKVAVGGEESSYASDAPR